ncbi:MAG TPA: hypothetical protein EYP56_16530, partial [Planctomycetaceae bacterium]|nr:hypothetical protein [Planctomycetaceae bacterium]
EPVGRAMAMAAYLRAHRYAAGRWPIAGVACTAALATERPKRGPHRAHLALQDDRQTVSWSIELAKEKRSRKEEEAVVGALLLNLVAEACGVDQRIDAGLRPDEQLHTTRTMALPAWQDLLAGRTNAVRHGPTANQPDRPPVLFPGAFNPLHQGHRRMAQIAEGRLGQPVEFEISVLNVDKPPLDFREMETRLAQFSAGQTVWLTRTPTFLAKAAQFPGAIFVVGTDTLARIADPRYYGGDQAACQAALETIARLGCRFLVFGRNLGQGFVQLCDLDLLPVLKDRCMAVAEHEFREDVSSTELRSGPAPEK